MQEDYKKDLTFGINGLGRIGRAILRKALKDGLKIPIINDINTDNANIAYQIKYDSFYGTLPNEIIGNKDGIFIDGNQSLVYHEKNIDAVPWGSENLLCVVDSSGIKENVVRSRNLDGSVKKIIITHSPEERLLDKSIVLGVNESQIDFKKDRIISSSICDAIAFAPVAKLLHSTYGIEHGFVTTLHPWLQHQNLLDGASISWSNPEKTYQGYEEGRASTISILPKPTSCVDATCKVLPELNGKIGSFSYRVPTPVVSTANINLKLRGETSKEEIIALFAKAAKEQKWQTFCNSYEPLVSIDFKGNPHSAIVDHRWTEVNRYNYLRLVLFYDNEEGYANQVKDLIKHILSNTI